MTNKDGLLRTEGSLLKTENILLKTNDGPKCEQKIGNTHPNKMYPPIYTETSDLDNYNNLSLLLSLKMANEQLNTNEVIVQAVAEAARATIQTMAATRVERT